MVQSRNLEWPQPSPTKILKLGTNSCALGITSALKLKLQRQLHTASENQQDSPATSSCSAAAKALKSLCAAAATSTPACLNIKHGACKLWQLFPTGKHTSRPDVGLSLQSSSSQQQFSCRQAVGCFPSMLHAVERQGLQGRGGSHTPSSGRCKAHSSVGIVVPLP